MSEFTLDIQLTELGFSNWNFPLCEPQSVKENFLPTQNGTEKPAPETETPTDCHEDACVVASSSADKSFLQDHQYYIPFKDNSSSNGETAQSNSKISSSEKDKVICNSWKRGRRKEGTEQRNDDEDQNGNEGTKNDDKEQKCSEVSQEASGLTIDDAVSGEERTDEDAEFVLTDDDDDVDEEEEVEEEEEDDVVEDKEEDDDDDDDVSWSGTVSFSKQWTVI